VAGANKLRRIDCNRVLPIGEECFMALSYRRFQLVQRRTMWVPTLLGFCLILLILFTPMVWWFTNGESFLSLTHRLPAQVLAVEGWIGNGGIRAAAAEFREHGYRYLVTTGGPADERWGQPQVSYAEIAEEELVALGIPENQIIVAPARDADIERTYESAMAERRALQVTGLQPKAINVFTLGAHARRSRLIYAKVAGAGTKVGVVSWSPPEEDGVPWWRSSNRAKNFLTETAGYTYEVLLNSGRGLKPSALETPFKKDRSTSPPINFNRFDLDKSDISNGALHSS
jgi:hypothetical protein